jgi:hypothetical protein
MAWGETFSQTLRPKLSDLLPNPPEVALGTSLVLAMPQAAERSPSA